MGHTGMGPAGSSDGPDWPDHPEVPPICSKCNKPIPLEKRITIPGRESECYDCYKAGRKTVCIDFDGVLAQYSGWKGPDHLGEPMAGAREFLQALADMGFEIVIHTTRNPLIVTAWVSGHGFDGLIGGITNQKVPAVAYIDDRAICFRGNFAETLMGLSYFSPWWKPTCSNCANLEDGVCYECAGENYGHATEAVANATCDNWRRRT